MFDFTLPVFIIEKLKLDSLLKVIILLFLCRYWYDDVVETVDCGDTAAQWLSKYLLNQDCGVRLGYHLVDTVSQRAVLKKFTQCYKTLRNSDLVTFEQFMYYSTAHFMLKRNHTEA